MKNIAAQMVNFDREQMRRIANNMLEQYDEKPQVPKIWEKSLSARPSRLMWWEMTALTSAIA
ncbi:TPA: hypothetical protein SI312_001868 [Escherichia coli]|nr:hypothetical protein [Escherichia coli]